MPKLEHISKYHSIRNLREKDYSNIVLTNDIEMHILEIPKIEGDEMLKDELVQWLRFIKEPENQGVKSLWKRINF